MELQKPKRRRGIILTPQGWRKFQDARHRLETQENVGERYTLEELGGKTGFDPRTVAKVLNRESGVDKQTLELLFKAFSLGLDRGDYSRPDSSLEEREGGSDLPSITFPDSRQDWGEAIDVSVFYGRAEELATLEQWLVDDRCRLVALLGMGGIGKTALSVKLAEQLQDKFEYVIWRSLRNAPPVQ